MLTGVAKNGVRERRAQTRGSRNIASSDSMSKATSVMSASFFAKPITP